MVQKRRTGGGRVTPSKNALAQASTAADAGTPPKSHTPGPAAVAASGRYTPKKPTYRIRPRCHRLAGWIGVALGLLLAVTNDAMLFTENDLLPFGHQEYYLMLAVLIGGSSTWFLGLFDRGTTVYD